MQCSAVVCSAVQGHVWCDTAPGQEFVAATRQSWLVSSPGHGPRTSGRAQTLLPRLGLSEAGPKTKTLRGWSSEAFQSHAKDQDAQLCSKDSSPSNLFLRGSSDNFLGFYFIFKRIYFGAIKESVDQGTVSYTFS